MKNKILLFGITIFYCIALSGQFTSQLVQLDSNKYQLFVKVAMEKDDSISLTKRLPYNVFKIRQADIDKDGTDDIILGVNKITHSDSVVRTRINI
jgi:hypothetical protein